VKVFVGWSGERSWQLATFLREWLKMVLQALDPWVSGKDIDKGAGWNAEVAKALQESHVGIICLTPENLQEPWLHFEAGALSTKKFDADRSHVCTYLFGLSPAEVPEGPLTQFQATRAEREDTKALLQTINKLLGASALGETSLDACFEKWWPDLEDRLRKIQSMRVESPPKRSREAMLEELLELVRGLVRSQSREHVATLEWLELEAGQRAVLEKQLRAALASPAADWAGPSVSLRDLGGRRRPGSVPPVAAPPPPPGSAPVVPPPPPDEEGKDG
jgi:hypothetical protein